jgi:type IV pilus assembly protein PilN
MRVRLNLATKPLESHRRFLVGFSLTVFAAAIVFVALSRHVYVARKADAEFRTRMDKTRQEMGRYEAQRADLERYFAQKEIASLHDRAAFINGIIDLRSFNWTQMFMDLERILPAGVRVISIEPKQAAGHVEVKLTVGTTGDEAQQEFLHALERSKEFSEVQVQRVFHPIQVGNASSDQKVVQLTVVYLGS